MVIMKPSELEAKCLKSINSNFAQFNKYLDDNINKSTQQTI